MTFQHTAFIIALALLGSVTHSQGQDRDHWYAAARSTLERMVGQPWHTSVARNVILFVGDGMGISTVTAARILRGQKMGRPGEEHQLAFEKFPFLALAKTYNNDAQVGDSSACATALMCGVKGNLETVGVDGTARFEDCFSSLAARVPSLFDWAQREGKSTGLVTTTRLTHATPAALYAHAASRYWEDDSKLPGSARNACKDIARQLMEDEPGRHINVMLGGGRRHLLPRGTRDPEHAQEEGRRQDGRNLIDDWVKDKKRRGLQAEYVWNKGQFDRVSAQNVDYLLGAFSYSHLGFEADRDKSPAGDPSLGEMTRKALEILRKSPHGFFLMVEAGRIDHAHHYNNAYRALEETLVLEDALEEALRLVNTHDTLMVVTADHSHVFTLGGTGTPRGNPILGVDTRVSDVDHMPYTTLLYSNGPGFSREGPGGTRPNLTGVDTQDRDYVQQTAVPRHWETHGGEDVAVYAVGPGSHLFRGAIDQTYIAHAIAYASCMGEHRAECQERTAAAASSAGGAPRGKGQEPVCAQPSRSSSASRVLPRVGVLVVAIIAFL